jgi:hypothetical protein
LQVSDGYHVPSSLVENGTQEYPNKPLEEAFMDKVKDEEDEEDNLNLHISNVVPRSYQ